MLLSKNLYVTFKSQNMKQWYSYLISDILITYLYLDITRLQTNFLDFINYNVDLVNLYLRIIIYCYKIILYCLKYTKNYLKNAKILTV